MPAELVGVEVEARPVDRPALPSGGPHLPHVAVLGRPVAGRTSYARCSVSWPRAVTSSTCGRPVRSR